MSISMMRIKAIFLEEIFLTKRSLEVIVDIIIFPLFNVILFGFISIFLQQKSSAATAQGLLMGSILWEMFRISQYTVSVSVLWEIWAKNLSNIFVSPLSDVELLTAYSISALFKSILMITLFSLVGYYIFHFSIFTIGTLNLVLGFINLFWFGVSLGIFLLGLIFRYGTRIQAVTWGIVFLLQPLTASFFPVTVLPKFMQYASYSLPPTYVFEAARFGLSTGQTHWDYHWIAALLNIVYFFLFFALFRKLMNGAKRTGQFAKSEG